MHLIRFRLGLRPRPCWESLQRSPDTLAEFKGPTSKGREGRRGVGPTYNGRELKGGRGGEESEREGKEKDGGGDGKWRGLLIRVGR